MAAAHVASPEIDAEMIVVGAGSAGAVIASRVTERADREVLLVRGGGSFSAPAPVPRLRARRGRRPTTPSTGSKKSRASW
jgi:choline dehydrogenase-like flavoprotein